MQENRRIPRRRVFYYLEILDLDTGEPLGRLGDISPTGIMILAEHPLTMNKTFRVSIRLPETGLLPEKELQLEVETRWMKPDLNPKILCTGCSIIKAKKESIGVINSLVEFYGFSDGFKHLKTPEF